MKEKIMNTAEIFDVVVVGGGPSGATAAAHLSNAGRKVALLDRAGRIKPCGGAVPPILIREFNIPDALIVAKVKSARMISPKGRAVDMPIEGGYVGMVDREHFDEWLRTRAANAGTTRVTGNYDRISRNNGVLSVHYEERLADGTTESRVLQTRQVIGADGAVSKVAKQEIKGAERIKFVYAYHEIVRSPAASSETASKFDAARCDVYYQGPVSPDFYGWIFPHGATTSIGTGSASKGFALRPSVASLRAQCGLSNAETLRHEGAPIPMKPLKCWDNGRDVVLAGDAAGVVAPASGEGIYYAMLGGQLAAEAVELALATGDARCLAGARKKFMRAHGKVFWVLGIMQKFWYSSDKRRERFVTMCSDPDVQHLTWQAYMHKKLVRAKPMAHLRIFFKDLGHLTGLVRS
jgi:geranylgeranyl diphosphate/geranylgeranyl-bacteriochlorophyllide a reductase